MRQYRTNQSEREFLKLLRAKFKFPAYTVLYQVPIPTVAADFRTSFRRVDALVIGSWASRQTAILGFEFKANRGSWLTELKNPKKAEEWAKFCDQWFVVASKGVVQKDEVPPNWGFYEKQDGVLSLVKQAETLAPKEVGRDIFFTIFQAMIDQLNPAIGESRLERRYEEGRHKGHAEARGDFVEALRDIRENRTRCDLDGIDRLLARSPIYQRAERIKIVEELIQRIASWGSFNKIESALKTVEFIEKRGLDLVDYQIRKTIEGMTDLLKDLEDHAKAIQETIREPGVRDTTAEPVP